MLAVFAAFETDVRRERQMEGIAMAKRRGAYTGGVARLDRARQAARRWGRRAGGDRATVRRGAQLSLPPAWRSELVQPSGAP